MNLKEYAQARKFYKKAMLLFQNINDNKGRADCMWSFGDLNLVIEKYKKAHMYYVKAIDIYREIGDYVSEASCNESLLHLLSLRQH